MNGFDTQPKTRASRYHPIPKRRTALAGFLVGLALMAGAGPAAKAALETVRNEGSASASAGFFGTSLPVSNDSASFGPLGGVAVAEVTGGRVRGVQLGSGLNAVLAEGRLGDIPEFILNAQTEIDVAVANRASAAEPLAFAYTINGGELRLFSPGGRFDGLAATVAASIFVIAPAFSGFLWEWGVTLRGTDTSVVAEVHGFSPVIEVRDPLGLGVPRLSPVTIGVTEVSLSIASFTATVDLGDLTPGGSTQVSYEMFADVSGPGLNNTGGHARLGDPFDLTSNPGSVIALEGVNFAAVVPEPSTWAMLLAGVLAVAAAVRLSRRREIATGRRA